MLRLFDEMHLVVYLTANLYLILALFFSRLRPGIARGMLSLLFLWGSFSLAMLAFDSPQNLAELSPALSVSWYRVWLISVVTVDPFLTCVLAALVQLAVGILLLFDGVFYKLGVLTGVLFFLLIMPLGLVALFPAGLIGVIALLRLLRQDKWIWEYRVDHRTSFSD